MVSLGGNSAFLSGYEAGSAVGYLCVKWVRMLVKSPQSCAFAMVPTLMVLTPLVNNDPLLVTHGIAAFHSGVKVASLIATGTPSVSSAGTPSDDAHAKERKKTDNPREGWENGTPPPHRDFKERGVVR